MDITKEELEVLKKFSIALDRGDNNPPFAYVARYYLAGGRLYPIENLDDAVIRYIFHIRDEEKAMNDATIKLLQVLEENHHITIPISAAKEIYKAMQDSFGIPKL